LTEKIREDPFWCTGSAFRRGRPWGWGAVNLSKQKRDIR